jgi:hypothetical protein
VLAHARIPHANTALRRQRRPCALVGRQRVHISMPWRRRILGV